MAKKAGVWGIDIGQAAFKALRCTLQNGEVVADAFDYIEYPKILSQPEAEPEKMVRDAIKQFLSRNDVHGYRIALAVPGQSGLAKFFKPPPVDSKLIPDIVKFEARQQIPFALEDVIWDFQQMGGGEVDGIALETEVGLFAMKREQVYRAMRPFQDVGVELDIIQLAPLSIYNFVAYDILRDVSAVAEYDPENPPPSLVVLSMGTDTTDLVITNGFRVWQRSVPLGGNHFTKQLTKELKLTFAKAEHLKRNARQAEDPRLVFQAMRAVFNDLVTEVQRSIGYFQGIDRKAKIDGVVVLGNAVKLPGLPQYLAKNLGYSVNNFEAFAHLTGSSVLSAPAFKDNQLSFGVCYGLCLQGLGVAKLHTNLVPREIMTERLVRSKKPWAVASVAALLLACTFNVFFHYGRLHQVTDDRAVAGISWKKAVSEIESAQGLSSQFTSDDQSLTGQLERITAIGEELVGNADRRMLWLEVLKAVNSALPQTPGVQPGEIPDVEKLPFQQREEIHVEQLEVQYFDDLSLWFNDEVQKKYIETQQSLGVMVAPASDSSAANETMSGDGSASGGGSATGPTGEGWVIQLQCYHYFNSDRAKEGLWHVNHTLISNLRMQEVILPVAVEKIRPGVMVKHQVQPAGQQPLLMSLRVVSIAPLVQPDPNTGADIVSGYQLALQGVETPLAVAADALVPVAFTMEEMGIGYPIVLSDSPINRTWTVPNPNYEMPEGGLPGGYPGSMRGPMGAGGMGAVTGMPFSSTGGGMTRSPAGSGLRTPSGNRGGTSDDGATDEKTESLEEPFLTVPRYDFVVQFVWKEVLLTERLEKQVSDWEKEKQKQGPQQPPADDELAANIEGGL
ncbi:MAG: pilus assembly protein PilM [Planctomycetaceae bacterium]|nr:pilus assembly protein PilM [Planctomycetaceae bacterium]